MSFQGDSIYWVEVEKVVPNPFQPRLEFDQSKLQELSESIRMYGVLQPLTVTRNEVQKDDGTFYTEYELIAGERRLRASKLAGIAQVPVIIREGEQSEQEKLELAIIENLQREDLNAVDRALAFRQLADVFKLSHVEVAKKVGRSREYVSNSIRLLGLPEKILNSLKQGDMSEGHARTLLMLTSRPEEQDVIFREILLKKMSVREVERIVRKIATDKVRKKHSTDIGSNLIEIEKQFTETLGTRVQIQKTDFGGKLTIDYFSEDDLAVILKRVKDEVPDVVNLQPEAAVEKIATHTPLEVISEPEKSAAPVPAAKTPVVPQQQPSAFVGGQEDVIDTMTDVESPQNTVSEPESYSSPVNNTPEVISQVTDFSSSYTEKVVENNNDTLQRSESRSQMAPVVEVSENTPQTPVFTQNNPEPAREEFRSESVPGHFEVKPAPDFAEPASSESESRQENVSKPAVVVSQNEVPSYSPVIPVQSESVVLEPESIPFSPRVITEHPVETDVSTVTYESPNKPDYSNDNVPAEVPVQADIPELPTKKVETEDDSGLYSMNNFGV